MGKLLGTTLVRAHPLCIVPVRKILADHWPNVAFLLHVNDLALGTIHADSLHRNTTNLLTNERDDHV
jgi:hypothetical protein